MVSRSLKIWLVMLGSVLYTGVLLGDGLCIMVFLEAVITMV